VDHRLTSTKTHDQQRVFLIRMSNFDISFWMGAQLFELSQNSSRVDVVSTGKNRPETVDVAVHDSFNEATAASEEFNYTGDFHVIHQAVATRPQPAA
jgi:hypothetical protein